MSDSAHPGSSSFCSARCNLTAIKQTKHLKCKYNSQFFWIVNFFVVVVETRVALYFLFIHKNLIEFLIMKHQYFTK